MCVCVLTGGVWAHNPGGTVGTPVSSLPGLQEIALHWHTVPAWCTGALGMHDPYLRQQDSLHVHLFTSRQLQQVFSANMLS